MVLQYSIIITYIVTFLKSLSKSKVKILSAFLFIFAVILYGFRNTGEEDTEVYYTVYSSFNSSYGNELTSYYGIDQGFLILMRLFSKAGVPFPLFRIIICVFSISLILLTMRAVTDNISIVFCLYLYFPYGYDSDQIRQFLAYSIVVYSLKYLLLKDKSLLKYMLCIGIASIIHVTAIVYLIYLLALLPDQKNIKNLIKVTAGLCALCVIGGANIIGIFNNIINNAKFTRYGFGESDYRMNVYLQIFEIVMFGSFLYLDNKILNKKDDEKYKILSSILNLSMFFLPFVLVSLSFERLMRPFIIFTYAVVSMKYDERKEKESWQPLVIVIALIIVRMSITFGYIKDMFEDCTLIIQK